MRAPGRSFALGLATVALFGCASGGPPAGAPQRPKETILMTEADDARAGKEGSEAVAAQIGVMDDPALQKYIDGIGQKLLRGVPRRGFAFQFQVVDQTEPNAFALPGGYVFVSRGLLLLANDEDELACVMGHEIAHVVNRHAAAQQAVDRNANPLSMGYLRAAQRASYSRDMERVADEDGQKLCAAAGYDPRAMSTFLQSLQQAERLRTGTSRTPGFFDTHPGSVERSAATAVRASELRWKPDPALGDTRKALLSHIDGLPIGDRPEAGFFQGDRFVHPDLGFQLRFPPGWETANTAAKVGARAPDGQAVVFLEGGPKAPSAKAAAEAWFAEAAKQQNLRLVEGKPVKVGTIDAWRLQVEGSGRGGAVKGIVTFIPYRGSTYVITGMSPAIVADRYAGSLLMTSRSFAPLPASEEGTLRTERLRIATAKSGEDVAGLGHRTDNRWPPITTAVYNALPASHRFQGGELVKIAKDEGYRASTR